MASFFRFFNNLGAVETDSPALRLQKRFLVYLGLAMSIGGLIWGTLSVYFQLYVPAIIPYGYTCLTAINFIFFGIFRNFRAVRFVQVLISLLLPFMFQYALGSFAATGAIMLWALISLVGAFTFESLRNTLYWLALYVILTLLIGFADSNNLGLLKVPAELSTVFFVLNISVISSIVAGLSYYFLKSRGQILEELAEAKRETDVVMSSVDEGLFLLRLVGDRYMVGSQQSDAVSRIFGIEKLPNTDFASAMTPFFNESKQKEIINFLELLRSNKVKGEMLSALNPLDGVAISPKGTSEPRYVKFGFSAVRVGQPDEYLARVTDITQAKLLQEQLEETERKNQENTQMILSVLQVGPAMLNDFLAGVDEELAIMSDILQNDKSPEEVKHRIEDLYRSVHSIKGNASLLDLKLLVNITHELEEKIIRIRAQERTEWNDFLPVAIDVSRLETALDSVRGLLTRLRDFHATSDNSGPSAMAAIPQALEEMVRRISAQYGKKVAMDFSAFEASVLPDHKASILRDILVQITRNAVVHGLEAPDVRRGVGKPETGTISLSLKDNDGRIQIVIKDDGASFNFDAIRKIAESKRNVDTATASGWTNKDLVKFLFEPGFSTAESADANAGRGMGLDIIRQRIKRIGGDLRISYGAGKFTEFEILFPSGKI